MVVDLFSIAKIKKIGGQINHCQKKRAKIFFKKF